MNQQRTYISEKSILLLLLRKKPPIWIREKLRKKMRMLITDLSSKKRRNPFLGTGKAPLHTSLIKKYSLAQIAKPLFNGSFILKNLVMIIPPDLMAS
jgi:hypothetical protein